MSDCHYEERKGSRDSRSTVAGRSVARLLRRAADHRSAVSRERIPTAASKNLLVKIALMALAFFSLLALLSWADVSFVIPATALSYVVGALGARLLLREHFGPMRWAGILLVTIGVAIVCAR